MAVRMSTGAEVLAEALRDLGVANVTMAMGPLDRSVYVRMTVKIGEETLMSSPRRVIERLVEPVTQAAAVFRGEGRGHAGRMLPNVRR